MKGDLYRYNRKRQLEGKRELSEVEFKEKFDPRAREKSTKESDGEESISGSGEDDLSSSSDDDDEDVSSSDGEGENEGDFMHDAVRAKEKRMMKRKEKKEYEVAATEKTSESGAKIVFQEEGEEKKCFAMYRAILLPDDVDFRGNGIGGGQSDGGRGDAKFTARSRKAVGSYFSGEEDTLPRRRLTRGKCFTDRVRTRRSLRPSLF